MIDNRFALNECLGIGGSSKVYSARDSTNKDFALKIIRKDKGYSEDLSKNLVENEFGVMTRLGAHPNIVNWVGANSEGTAALADGVHSIRYLVLECCKHGSLSSVIRQTGPLEETVAKFLFLQLWHATRFIHEKSFAHLDIKLENILLDDCFNIKLADLGTAIDIGESLGFTDKKRGTMVYMAPEMKNKQPDDMVDATIADVYSLGVCLHLLLTAEFPTENEFNTDFSSMETESSTDLKSVEKLGIVKSRLKYLSEDARDFLEEMLEDNAFFRLSIDEVIQHPWLKDFDYSGVQNEVYSEMASRMELINKLQPIRQE